MTVAQSYLPPILALMSLSFLTALAILVTRIADLVVNRRGLAHYAEFDGVHAPAFVIRPTRQLANQFEFPVFFYMILVLAIGLGLTDALLATLAWCYVGLRWAHALSHIGFNRLYVRTPLFMAGNGVLLAMAVCLACDTLL